MRSTLIICVLVVFIIRKECEAVSYEDFKPTPIPLREWGGGRRDERAGTLHEIITTNTTTAVAAIPPHYWEDALRHSVYLTLVRDKIDQLIAQGSVISPDTKPEPQELKEIDDRHLWEKIKNAPFDRLKPDESAPLGDITIMAKGRLLEDNDGYRFTEDEKTKEKCNEQKCMEGVKAFWSVKRARQRDSETVPGKYHYELTFSVTSHLEKEKTKPYENPVRTFTVRETKPTEAPARNPETIKSIPRPHRAVWVHKNIGHSEQRYNKPVQHRKAYYGFGLDKLIYSLFNDDDEPKEEFIKYRPNGPPQNNYNTKMPPNYPHKYQTMKYGRPQPQPPYTPQYPYPIPPVTLPTAPIVPSISPPVQPPLASPPLPHPPHNFRYPEKEQYPNKHHSIEYKYQPSNHVKTTKPGIPTTPITFTSLNMTMELPTVSNISDVTTREPELITYKMHTKPTMSKLNYFPEHVRPPVYTAPPGVFVTMDKKPFKPMPPLKMTHYPKPYKNKPPSDFRPSPQVMDVQFSDPLSDPLLDSFRPISLTSGDSNITDFSVLPAKTKNNSKVKPLKKPEGPTAQRTTTNAPDIITAHNLSMEKMTLDTMQWANNVLGAFTKTNPIDSLDTNASTEVSIEPEATSPMVTSTEIYISTLSGAEEQPVTATSPISRKRTRPPSKFGKITKVKKVKRVTTTTSTTTEQTPLPSESWTDLNPQASSGNTKPTWQHKKNQEEPSTKPATTTTESTTASVTTTTTPRPTTTRRTTTRPSTTTTATSPPITQTNSRNRFRQSTLMIKGTSVKHDKWNSPNSDKGRPITTQSVNNNRRKASNFQGYMSTPKTVEDEHRREEHVDFISDNEVLTQKNNNENTTAEGGVNGNVPEQYPDDELDILNEGFEVIRDHNEFIFNVTSNVNEDFLHNVAEIETTTTPTISSTASTEYPAKNKTKCKKKSVNESASTEPTESSNSVIPIENTTKGVKTTERSNTQKLHVTTTSTDKHTQTEPLTEASENRESMSEFDKEVQKFLESINTKGPEIYEPENEPDEEDDDYFGDLSKRRKEDDVYEDFHERQYSLLDLMMES